MADKDNETPVSAPAPVEKVDKKAPEPVEIVLYSNSKSPNETHELPKADWEHLEAQKLTRNLIFRGVKGPK